MLADHDRLVIEKYAAQFHARTVVLFGSSLGDDAARDIDIGVSGLADRDFFPFLGRLFAECSRPVDIINLDHNSSFTELIKKRGRVIYGAG